MRPLEQEEGGGHLVEFPEYSGCIADGETPEDATAEGADAPESYRNTSREPGRPTPASGDIHGGHWRQCVPKSLHAALARRADHVGVSLGMLVTTTLAEDLGRRIQAPLAPRESRRRCSAMASWRKNCRDDAMMSGCGNVVVLAAFSSCANMGRLRKGAESCALSTEYVISEFSPFTVADQTMAATGIPA